MTDPIIIERADLEAIIFRLVDNVARNSADQAINRLIDELGLKKKPSKPFVSEHHAVRVMKVNLARLTAAADRGIVERKLVHEKQTHNRFYRRSDVQKLINDPAL
jgi:hypothetical protein